MRSYASFAISFRCYRERFRLQPIFPYPSPHIILLFLACLVNSCLRSAPPAVARIEDGNGTCYCQPRPTGLLWLVMNNQPAA
jgi:hypothetical protein